jgi:multidrug efflux pump subunit AcrA (membrane-fusion protein)
VPEASLVSRDGNSFVFTLNPDSTVRLTHVAAGTRQRGRVEITAGLRPEDRIVGTGAGFVKDGDLVRIGGKS